VARGIEGGNNPGGEAPRGSNATPGEGVQCPLATSSMQSYVASRPFIPLRFARFLQRWGKIEEAARQYETVLRRKGSDPELLEMSAEELDEMADFSDLVIFSPRVTYL